MTPRAKTTILAFSLVTLLASQFAEAARLGSGRSSGMRRSAPTQSYQQRPVSPPPQQAAPAPAPQQAAPAKKGIGVGTALAGAAAAGAIGYMAGSATSNHPQAAPAPQATASAPAAAPVEQAAPAPAPEKKDGMPWMLIIALGLLLVAGLAWFRRSSGMTQMRPPEPVQPAGNGFGGQGSQDGFAPIPKIGSGLGGTPAPTRLPDGTETPYFLRQAKATFLHLQSLNTPDSLEEVRKYMTPDLFESLRGDIAGNSDVADFQNLDCQLVDSTTESGRFIASVRFQGLVSENVHSAPVPFAETWHYVKDPAVGDRWLVAGIQQD